jgi:hypothetical protein
VSPGDVNPGSAANARFAAKQFQSQAFRSHQYLILKYLISSLIKSAAWALQLSFISQVQIGITVVSRPDILHFTE